MKPWNRIRAIKINSTFLSRTPEGLGLSASILFTLGSCPLSAQTYQTWRSENTQSSWQNSSAWWNFPNPSPIVFGQQEWDNNVQATQTSSADVNTWRFLFKSGANAVHSFSGNQISFFDFGGQDPMIINESSATHVINNNIVGDNAGVDPLIVDIKGSGGLKFGGTINNNSNVLNVQGSTASITTVTFNGSVSGGGGFYKDNSNITAVFGTSNSYSGQTTINAGTLRVNLGATLGSGDVRIASGGNLELYGSSTVASVAELGTSNSGTVSLGTGATLTINGASKGALFQNSISGSGNLTMAGSGTTSLGLFGTQSYTGTTTVSGGKLSSGVTMATSAVVVNGGRFEMTADNRLADTATLSISGGFLDLLGTDTVKSLTSTGGTVALGSGKILTVTDSSNVGTGSTVIGGTLRATGGTLGFQSSGGSTAAVTIESGAKLAGIGKIGGNTTILGGGVLAPGNSPGVLTVQGTTTFSSGSMFEWEIDTAQGNPTTNRGTAYDGVNTSAVSGSGAIFKIMLTGSQDFADGFWNQDRTWTDIFKSADGSTILSNWASVFSGGLQYSYNGQSVAPTSQGYFTTTGSSLTWSAVPEPSNLLAGMLAASALLRRRRSA